MLVPADLLKSLPATSVDRIARATIALWVDTLYLCLEDSNGKVITSGLYHLANGTAQTILEIEPECMLLPDGDGNGLEIPLVLLPACLGENDGKLPPLPGIDDVVMLDVIWPDLRELLAEKRVVA